MATVTPPTGFRTVGALRYIIVPPRLTVVARPLAGGRSFTPMTGSQARELVPEALAVVDGPMFSVCGPDAARRPGESEVARYARASCGSPDYRVFDHAAGIDVPSHNPRAGLTVSLVGRRVVVNDDDVVAPGADVAIQLRPGLVRNGQIVATNAGPNAERNWRVGIGVLGDGNLVFAISQSAMVAFAIALQGIGVTDAGYTDGGGSGRIELKNGARAGSSENRRVPIWIAAMPDPSAAPVPPPRGGAGGSEGSSTGGAVLGLGIAAGGLWGLGKWRGWW